MVTATRLITAEEYARMPEPGVSTELVRGEIVERNVPKPRHGEICSNASWLLKSFVKEQDLGRVACNDAGIVTERDPDSVRGGDVWFVSYQKIPKGPLPQKYLEVPPDIVIEVKSVFDRWSELLAKVAEYLRCGVAVVCVLDPETETVRLYYADKPEVIVEGKQQVTFPEQLPGFSVEAKAFFE
ncbi:MAG: Uma2 family endonuclease [Planctomycetaceae bacterium]|nr:Uma2 family endonuclease [Planctomycetaceae bacterium]